MSAPGVVVVHGGDARSHVAEYADELTMAGFAVETVDAPVAALVAAAVARLRAAGASVVGAVGFSAGGDVVLQAASEGRVDAAVAYDPDTAGPGGTRAACPVQLHVGTGGAPHVPDDVAAYVAALEAAGTPVDHFAYPGAARRAADRAADRGTRTGDTVAGDVARARTIGFLHARLAR